MFNVGGMELLVIGLVALIVLGPDKLPGAIRQVGQVVGELRRISSSFQTDLKGALTDAEREAEAERRANAAAPASDTPDPGAARAAAHAELAAAEAALDDDTPSSGDDVGSEGHPEASSSGTDEDSSRAAS
ncbi:Sec-independent protein translocase protein TatB [Actinospongicola halichondriae]|uniref:Sec-independent protein translocase protein TatB n=1 Tax=Actinospongicola halichondriae TaxID=3236844 RepID=UPI003D4F6F24